MKWFALLLGCLAIALTGCSGTVSVQLGDKPGAAVAKSDKPAAADAVEQMFEALNAAKTGTAKTSKPTDKVAANLDEPVRKPQVFEAPPDVPARASRKESPARLADSGGEVRIEPIAGLDETPAPSTAVKAAPPQVKVSEPVIHTAAAPAPTPATPPAIQAAPKDRLLKIASLVACSRIEAFGRYTVMDTTRIKAGRAAPMLLYTEIEGFTHRTSAGMPAPEIAEGAADDGRTEWVVELTQKVTIRRDDKWGTLVQENVPQIARDVSMRRRRDHYLVQRITLPPTLAPGAYVLTVEVVDQVTRQTAQQNMPITILAK